MVDSRRALRAATRPIPLRRLVPNLITLLGLCAGLTAIRMAIEGRFDIAVYAIVVAAILDGLDGRMARLLKANSKFGAELDSLADFVNFGVAPAIALYLWGLKDTPSFGWIAVLIFTLAAALRLARFNVAAAEAAEAPAWRKGFFTGAPTPAGAILLLLPIYLQSLGLPLPSPLAAPLLVVYALAVAGLMISRIPTFSGKFDQARIERSHAPAVIVAAAFFFGVLATYPFLTLTLATLAYAASIPVAARVHRAHEEREAKLAEAAPGLRPNLSVVPKGGRPGGVDED